MMDREEKKKMMKDKLELMMEQIDELVSIIGDNTYEVVIKVPLLSKEDGVCLRVNNTPLSALRRFEIMEK